MSEKKQDHFDILYIIVFIHAKVVVQQENKLIKIENLF